MMGGGMTSGLNCGSKVLFPTDCRRGKPISSPARSPGPAYAGCTETS